MRILYVGAFLFAITSCGTKINPDLCCTTQADCDAVGIPLGTGCADGLVCRGNQCIGETCADSSSCDAAAPYCSSQSQSCVESCTDDSQCPGFGQGATDTFCVAGTCAACREDHDDCPASAPVCDAGSCRACRVDADCPSQLCDVDTGACLASLAILYASPSGDDAANCSQATPCSVSHAISLIDINHKAMRLLDGTYALGIGLPASTNVSIVGPGATITGFTPGGGAITIAANSVVSARGLTINSDGFVACNGTGGTSSVSMRDVRQIGFAPTLTALSCNVSVATSNFQGAIVMKGAGGTVTVDRSTFLVLDATFADHTVVDIQNSVMFQGVDMSQDQTAHPLSGRIAFSTFYLSTFFSCGSAQLNLDNDIFFTTGSSGFAIGHPTPCVLDHNLAFPQNAPVGNGMLTVDPKFVGAANSDFHLMAASPAIDAANPTDMDAVDFDGVSRPQGNGRDMGAFEFH